MIHFTDRFAGKVNGVDSAMTPSDVVILHPLQVHLASSCPFKLSPVDANLCFFNYFWLQDDRNRDFNSCIQK
jgi:hypothetical protein